MECPHCKNEIPADNGRLFICPFCNSILDDELMQHSNRQTDSAGCSIEEYIPNRDKVYKYGQFCCRTVNALLEGDNDFGKRMVIFGLCGLLMLGLTILSIMIKNVVWSLFFGVITSFFVVFIIKDIVNKNKPHDFYEFFPHFLPIRYYGNENIFGFVVVPCDCNRHATLPPIHFVEIDKKDILDIEDDYETKCHFILFDGKVDVAGNQEDYVEIPSVFDEELFDVMYRT